MVEAEEKRKQQEEARNRGGVAGRQRNQAPSAAGPTSSRSETIRYESSGERDDDTLDVID